MNNQTNLGRRFLAGLIDYTIIIGFTYAYIMHYGTPNDEGGYTVTGFAALIPPLFWFIMTVLLEQALGATIGNGIVSLKPVSDIEMNRKPSFTQSLKRHLLDLIDMFFFGLVGIILIKNTPKRQRLGDIWAKTIVLKDLREKA